MIKTDESALICDLAETYHIYDYRSLPLRMVATFSVGLRNNSRIKMALAGIKYPLNTLLLAAILDGINLDNWTKTENYRNGEGRPQTMVNALLGKETENQSDRELFATAEDFENERKRLMEGK